MHGASFLLPCKRSKYAPTFRPRSIRGLTDSFGQRRHMRSIAPRSNTSILFLLLLPLFTLSTLSINAQTYSGDAAAVRSTVNAPLLPVLTTGVNDTGPLPSGGGSITLQS